MTSKKKKKKKKVGASLDLPKRNVELNLKATDEVAAKAVALYKALHPYSRNADWMDDLFEELIYDYSKILEQKVRLEEQRQQVKVLNATLQATRNQEQSFHDEESLDDLYEEKTLAENLLTA